VAGQLTSNGFNSRAPAWHPGGERLAVESDHAGTWHIDILDVASSQVIHLGTSPASDDRAPSWSPNGRQLAFVRSDDRTSFLHVVDITSAHERRLAGTAGAMFPDWSPDGSTIVFSAPVHGTITLRSIDVASGELREVLLPAGRDVWPRWSPLGDALAFFSRRDTDGKDDEVYILDLGSMALERLTVGPGHDFCPAWSPSGADLVFVSVHEDGSRVLEVVTRSGEPVRQIAPGFFRVTEPSWSPDGRSIAYAARRTASDSYRIYVERL
jgi:TolB protein